HTTDHADLGPREKPGDAARPPVDDPVLPGEGLREVELPHPLDGHAERLVARHVEEPVGGMDQRLRRDAAANEAGAAEPPGLDQNGVEAELAGADRGDITAQPAAE